MADTGLLQKLIETKTNPSNMGQLNFMQETVKKTVEKILKKTVEEKAQQNVPLEKIIEAFNIPLDEGPQTMQQEPPEAGKPSGAQPLSNAINPSTGKPYSYENTLMTALGNVLDFAMKNPIGTSRKLAMENVGLMQELLGQKPQEEDPWKKQEMRLKQLQIEELESSNKPLSTEEMFTQMNIPQEQREDYQVKITNENIRGIIKQIPTMERKKTLPATEIKDYNLLSNAHRMMKKNKEFLEEKGLAIGPGLSTRPGAVADILGQMKGSDFNTWKASVGRAFDIYRKWITGAQASYREINWIAPNYPKATDSQEIFTRKSLDVMKDIEENSKNLLNNFSEGGYAVSGIRKNLTLESQSQGNEFSKMSDEELRKIAGGL